VRPLLVDVLFHFKWFTDPRPHPTEYDLLLSWPVVAAFALAIGAAGVAYLIQHRVPEPLVVFGAVVSARLGSGPRGTSSFRAPRASP
jgi:hypothetical protein